MLHGIQRTFWAGARGLLGLRYRVTVSGLDKLASLDGPTLVMPNHPGFIDPPVVLSQVRLRKPLRALVYAGTYRNPVLYPIMRLIDALEVPDLAEHSQSAHQRTLATIDSLVEGLRRGENFLVYPSGRIQRRDCEVVGAARAASDILARAPEANVVLVRTRGLWGSMFTFAPTGQYPDLNRGFLRAAFWIAANLVFFAPRRRVHLTVEPVPRDQLPSLDRDALNRFLEDWYNRGGPERPTYVPYHFLLGRRHFDFPELAAGPEVDLEKIRPQTRQTVNEMVAEHLGRPLEAEELRPDATLDRIGLDSLERMDLALQIEDRFGFRSDRVADTLGELWALAEGLSTGSPAGDVAVPEIWTRQKAPDVPAGISGETLAEAFVRRAVQSPDDVVLADRFAGVLTYRRLLVGCQLLGKRLAKLPGKAVGILLPASAGAELAFFGLQMAGKLPVMMNWTTGPAQLAHAVRTLGVQHVLTSRRFIDRLRIQVEGAEFVFLEELRAQIGRLELLRTLAATYALRGSFLRAVPRQDPDAPAVVLFTSGSESTPKAVPLTHRNLLANCQASMVALGLRRNDVLLGSLPPFHSFGLLGNVIAPLVAGFRLVCHPDPTDARGLVRLTAQFAATVTITTPTFLGYLLATGSAEELRSLRFIVTGAEKCPAAIFARCAEVIPQAEVIEGYGITECSPVVAANLPGQTKAGTVGRPVLGVEVCVVEPETKRPLPVGDTGMLLVRGPSVFDGYLHYDGADPFVNLGGHRWYETGDLVALDDDGYIHFQGRLKRFLKAGGEMISLPALEEPLTRRYPPTDEGPQVAVEGVERPEGRHIVLFSTREIPVREANRVLADAGFRGVMRIDECRRLESIPVLGTGKTDYKLLRKMI